MTFLARKKTTRIRIIAHGQSSTLNWDTTAERVERERRGNPLAPLRKAFSQRVWCVKKHSGRRPHFCGTATFSSYDELDALMAMINSCTIDSLDIELLRGGRFTSSDVFFEEFVNRLEIPVRQLNLRCRSSSLPLYDLERTVPAIQRYRAKPTITQFAEVSLAGHGTQAAYEALRPLHLSGWLLYGSGMGEKLKFCRYRVYPFRPNPPFQMAVMRALATARILLLAKRSERTGIADLPTDLLHDIIRASVFQTETQITQKMWGVILRHAEDREAFTAVAREFARIGPRRDPHGRDSRNRICWEKVCHEWMFNGGFWARLQEPAK